jgi:hypothetical protein
MRQCLSALERGTHGGKRLYDIPASSLLFEHQKLDVVADHTEGVVDLVDKPWGQSTHRDPVAILSHIWNDLPMITTIRVIFTP